MPKANPGTAAGAPDATAIESQRAYLLRYALLQLRNRESADDTVQETLLGDAISRTPGLAGVSGTKWFGSNA